MPTEDLVPQTELENAEYSAHVIGDIQDDPDSPDGNFWTWDGNGNTIVRVPFPSPSGDLTTGAGLQTFKCWVKKSSIGSNPGYSLQLYEAGSIVGSALQTGTVTSATGELLTATWNAADLADISGADVELRLVQTSGGTGSPSLRRGLVIGAAKWNADYVTPPAGSPRSQAVVCG
jgi:hypothetical protein